MSKNKKPAPGTSFSHASKDTKSPRPSKPVTKPGFTESDKGTGSTGRKRGAAPQIPFSDRGKRS